MVNGRFGIVVHLEVVSSQLIPDAALFRRGLLTQEIMKNVVITERITSRLDHK